MLERVAISTLFVLTSVSTTHAFAYEPGDFIVRAGVTVVTTNEHSSHIKLDRGAGAPADLGGKAAINNRTHFAMNFSYMLTSHWGVELLGAVNPLSHSVRVKGTNAVDGKLGSVKYLPPTLNAVYFPLDSASRWQPYVGAGVNYTVFFNGKTGNHAKAGDNQSNTKLTSFKVKNSWGWAAQVGLDYKLTDKLLLNGQVRYLDIDTTAYVGVEHGANRAKANVDIRPVVYMLGLGYVF